MDYEHGVGPAVALLAILAGYYFVVWAGKGKEKEGREGGADTGATARRPQQRPHSAESSSSSTAAGSSSSSSSSSSTAAAAAAGAARMFGLGSYLLLGREQHAHAAQRQLAMAGLPADARVLRVAMSSA